MVNDRTQTNGKTELIRSMVRGTAVALVMALGLIDTDSLVALENSDIDANAFGGPGGQVRINAQGIFTEFRSQQTPESDTAASSDLRRQFSGIVEINTPDVEPSQGLAQLPDAPVNVEVAQSCQTVGGKQASVEFFNTDRGDLAPSLYEPLSSSEIWEDVLQGTKTSAGAARSLASPSTQIIIGGLVYFTAQRTRNCKTNDGRCCVKNQCTWYKPDKYSKCRPCPYNFINKPLVPS